MAKRYTSTLQVRCWKEHECAACASTYSYILARKVVGQGPTAEKAQASMQLRVAKTVQDDTDMQPCPTCGLYQNDMIGRRRAKRRMQILVVAMICLAIAVIINAADGLQSNVVTWIVAVICGLAILAHLALEMQNPNRNLDANQKLAQDRVARGEMRHKPGQANARPDDLARPSRPMLHMAGLWLLGIAMFLVVAPEVVRSSRGWPLNESCYPPVVGPSDNTRIYMPDSIESVKGFWRGAPSAVLTCAGSVTRLESSTNQNDWGSTIYAKTDEKSNHSHPWVNVTLPDKPEFAGKVASCQINLALDYPEITSDGSSFHVVHRTISRTLSLNLAPRGAGAQYRSLWWGGTLGGSLLLFLASLFLYMQARAFASQAKPTKAFAV